MNLSEKHFKKLEPSIENSSIEKLFAIFLMHDFTSIAHPETNATIFKKKNRGDATETKNLQHTYLTLYFITDQLHKKNKYNEL